MFALWLLRDNAGAVQTYASLADCLIAQAELLLRGLRPTIRLLEVTRHSGATH